jgi:hypothetical protein
VILDHVAAGDDGAARQVQRADFEVIDVFAPAALEMVVVPQPGSLITGLAIGKDYRLDALRLEQQIQRPVHRRNSQGPKRRLRAPEDLLDRDRALRIRDDLENGIALPGITLAKKGGHARNVTAATASAQGKRSPELTTAGIRRTRAAVQERFKAAGRWFTVLSLCAALGFHWAALQSVAWVGMLISYSHSGSVASAVEKTFDGRHPCPLCKAIGKARQSGKKQDIQASSKMDMDYRRPGELLIPPMQDFKWAAFLAKGLSFSSEPGVPPPRAA